MSELYRVMMYLEPYSNKVKTVKEELTKEEAEKWVSEQDEPKRYLIYPQYI